MVCEKCEKKLGKVGTIDAKKSAHELHYDICSNLGSNNLILKWNCYRSRHPSLGSLSPTTAGPRRRPDRRRAALSARTSCWPRKRDVLVHIRFYIPLSHFMTKAWQLQYKCDSFLLVLHMIFAQFSLLISCTITRKRPNLAVTCSWLTFHQQT